MTNLTMTVCPWMMIFKPGVDGQMLTSTPIRGSIAHRSETGSNSSDFEDNVQSQTPGDEENSHTDAVQLALSDDEPETVPGLTTLSSTLALGIQKALGEDQDLIYFMPD